MDRCCSLVPRLAFYDSIGRFLRSISSTFPSNKRWRLLLVALGLPAWLAFATLFTGTLAISALLYWLVLYFLPWLHPFFGIPPIRATLVHSKLPTQASMFPYHWTAVVGRNLILYLVSPLLFLVTVSTLAATALQSWQPRKVTPIIQQQEAGPLSGGQGRALPTPGFPKDEDEP